MSARRHRLITVILALVSLLFMQLAVAGYACPQHSGDPSAEQSMAGMPCADEMPALTDSEQPGLCHAHCQSADQTADKAQSPAPAAAIAVGFAYTVEPALDSWRHRAPPPPWLSRATEPPLAVRNCCFRL
jgi:hypothetical protein